MPSGSIFTFGASGSWNLKTLAAPTPGILRDFVWGPHSAGTLGLLRRDLKYGPLFRGWPIMPEYCNKGSESGAHTRGPYLGSSRGFWGSLGFRLWEGLRGSDSDLFWCPCFRDPVLLGPY